MSSKNTPILSQTTPDLFRMDGKVAIITGGAGMLGMNHAKAIAELGGIPVLLDSNPSRIDAGVQKLRSEFGEGPSGHVVDITNKDALCAVIQTVIKSKGHIDVLINNAAMTVESNIGDNNYFAPFEEYDVALWERALKVSLTGTFICTQAIGKHMKLRGSGVILNIASDVGVISPDHRIYEPDPTVGYPGTSFNTPVSYAVAKAGLISATRYWATYWAKDNIRVNSISPAGVYTSQDQEFVKKLSALIPLGRMAKEDEYKGAIAFLVSDASAFMTGFNLIMDGGRTAW